MVIGRERLKALPVVGSTLKLLHEGLQFLFRQGAFGTTRKHQANLRFFRKWLSGVSQRVVNPIFVKVGANDGLTDDPCSDLLRKNPAWKGLLIEPVPYLFERLKENFPDRERFRLDQVAVGPAGSSIFYYIDPAAKDVFPDLPNWFDQIGSFDRSHISKHFGSRLDAYLRKKVVDIQPLRDVLERNDIQQCHLLHIDTEGFDYKVLGTLDFRCVRPEAIFVEHKHLPLAERVDMVKILKRESYRVRDCGDDYFALRENVG